MNGEQAKTSSENQDLKKASELPPIPPVKEIHQRVFDWIENLQGENGLPFERLIEKSEEEGLSRSELDRAFLDLMDSGDIEEPTMGRVRVKVSVNIMPSGDGKDGVERTSYKPDGEIAAGPPSPVSEIPEGNTTSTITPPKTGVITPKTPRKARIKPTSTPKKRHGNQNPIVVIELGKGETCYQRNLLDGRTIRVIVHKAPTLPCVVSYEPVNPMSALDAVCLATLLQRAGREGKRLDKNGD